jgi:hypothetical protein
VNPYPVVCSELWVALGGNEFQAFMSDLIEGEDSINCDLTNRHFKFFI